MRYLTLLCAILWAVTWGAAAQDADPAAVTLDDVNAIAATMFCPDCENIPLDKCGTSVCVQWKDEIARMLADGQNAETIRADFVARFGERVLAVPGDPTLRALSLAAPWLLAGLAALMGLAVLVRLRGGESDAPPAESASGSGDDDPYRARLERDLKG